MGMKQITMVRRLKSLYYNMFHCTLYIVYDFLVWMLTHALYSYTKIHAYNYIYTYTNTHVCIHTNISTGISRIVAFNFRVVTTSDKDYEYLGLESELNDLRQGLDLLKDHQSYMNQREDVHKRTLEGIDTKVLCWTILEAAILIGMTFWQISYISSFFETKRKL